MANTTKAYKVQVQTIRVECDDRRIPAKRAAADAAAAELRELTGADVRVVMRRGHAPVLRVRSWS